MGAINFVSVPDLFPTGDIKLANGTLAIDANLWAAVAMAWSADGLPCTSTLIGPRVLLTAAHCVDNADAPVSGADNSSHTRPGTAKFAGSLIPLVSCAMHPAYADKNWIDAETPRSDLDVALCELSAPVSRLIMETVDTGARPNRNDPLLLTGYGCINIRVSNEKIKFDPGRYKLRMGDATIDAAGVADVQGRKGSYLRTKSTGGEPILCPGDSGGPAFRGVSLGQQASQGRRVLAVNSMVEAVPNGAGHAFYSYATLLTDPAFKRFQQAWTAERPASRKVCGIEIAAGTDNCRR